MSEDESKIKKKEKDELEELPEPSEEDNRRYDELIEQQTDRYLEEQEKKYLLLQQEHPELWEQKEELEEYHQEATKDEINKFIKFGAEGKRTLKIRKLYELYLKQVSFVVAGNEWMKPLVFHVVLSQLLRTKITNKKGKQITVPMFYKRGLREISIKESCFIIAPSRSGKGEIMNNAVDIIKDVEKTISGWNGITAHYMDSEPTVQFLRGGNELVKGNWYWVDGVLSDHVLIAWSEGEALVNPKSSYGDFKHVILSALDDRGEVSVTARKDLISAKNHGGKKNNTEQKTLEAREIPSIVTTTSIITGSVYKDSFSGEILNSGLLQRFLFSYREPSFQKNIEQMKQLAQLLTIQESQGYERARKEFVDYFRDVVYSKIDLENSAVFLKDASDRLEEILSNYPDPGYTSGEKIGAFNSFINSAMKHVEKIAAAAAIVDCEGKNWVTLEHVNYAWEVCKPVFDDYVKLFEHRYLPDFTPDQKRRVDIIVQILNDSGDEGVLNQNQLLSILGSYKKRGNWDLGFNSTVKFLTLLCDRGTLQTAHRLCRNGKGRENVYRIVPVRKDSGEI